MNESTNIKFTIGICDDEKIHRYITKSLCTKFIDKKKIKAEIIEFSSGEELLKSKIDIDILFLDIVMDGISGIAIKNKYERVGNNTIIIFQTSHKNKMQDAFGPMVFSFLIKPIDEKELYLVMERAIKKIKGQLVVEVEYEYQKHWIKADNIIYIKADDKYTSIITVDRSCFARRKMSEWEMILNDHDFYRVHRCFIININHIKKVEGYRIIMNNNDYVNISKKRRKDFLKELHCFYKRNAL